MRQAQAYSTPLFRKTRTLETKKLSVEHTLPGWLVMLVLSLHLWTQERRAGREMGQPGFFHSANEWTREASKIDRPVTPIWRHTLQLLLLMRYTYADGNWDSGVFVPAPYQLMHINAGALTKIVEMNCRSVWRWFFPGEGRITPWWPIVDSQALQSSSFQTTISA